MISFPCVDIFAKIREGIQNCKLQTETPFYSFCLTIYPLFCLSIRKFLFFKMQFLYFTGIINQKPFIMRKITILLLAVVFSLSSNAGIIYVPANATDNGKSGTKANDLNSVSLFSLTPSKVEELTGKKMNFIQKIAFKAAQKKAQKRAAGEISKGLYIVLAIFGLAWIGMGVMDEWKGSTWIVNLVLTLLFWLPGFIHALVVMKKYYK